MNKTIKIKRLVAFIIPSLLLFFGCKGPSKDEAKEIEELVKIIKEIDEVHPTLSSMHCDNSSNNFLKIEFIRKTRVTNIMLEIKETSSLSQLKLW